MSIPGKVLAREGGLSLLRCPEERRVRGQLPRRQRWLWCRLSGLCSWLRASSSRGAALHVDSYDPVGLAAVSAASHFDCFLDFEVSSLAVRAVGEPVSNNRLFPLYSLQR